MDVPLVGGLVQRGTWGKTPGFHTEKPIGLVGLWCQIGVFLDTADPCQKKPSPIRLSQPTPNQRQTNANVITIRGARGGKYFFSFSHGPVFQSHSALELTPKAPGQMPGGHSHSRYPLPAAINPRYP